MPQRTGLPDGWNLLRPVRTIACMTVLTAGVYNVGLYSHILPLPR